MARSPEHTATPSPFGDRVYYPGVQLVVHVSIGTGGFSVTALSISDRRGHLLWVATRADDESQVDVDDDYRNGKNIAGCGSSGSKTFVASTTVP
jgi:hypothetical protein